MRSKSSTVTVREVPVSETTSASVGGLTIQGETLVISTDQRIEVARLELVGLLGQGLKVADPIVAGAGLEHVAEGQRGERRVAARAAAFYGQPVRVDVASVHEVAGSVHAVVDVDDAPLAVEAPAIVGPKARTPTVVDVQHREPSTDPILEIQSESGRRCARWAAVAYYQEGGAFARRGNVVPVCRPIEERVCSMNWSIIDRPYHFAVEIGGEIEDKK